MEKKCFESIFSMKLLLKLRCKKSVNFFSQSNISAPKPRLLRAAVKLTSLSILGVCCLSFLIRKVEVSEQKVPFRYVGVEWQHPSLSCCYKLSYYGTQGCCRSPPR